MANEPEMLESLHKQSEKINKGLDVLYFELGKEAYAELRDKEAPNNEVELLAGRITALNKRIERIEETIQSVQKESLERARASSTYACPLCGSEVMGSDGFCMSCGTKLDRHCSNCGAPLGPEYRQYNPNAVAGSHNYTKDPHERDSLVRIGWRDEGIGWYGVR